MPITKPTKADVEIGFLITPNGGAGIPDDSSHIAQITQTAVLARTLTRNCKNI